MVLPGHLARRIVVAPKPSQVNVFASLDRPIIVIRPKPAEVPILRLVGLLRHIRGVWSLLAKILDLNSANVSLDDRLGLIGAGRKSPEVVVLCLLSSLRYITGLRSPLADMPDLTSCHVSLDRLGFMGAGRKSSGVVIRCLLGLLGLIILFRGIEALPPGVHLGNVSLVLITAIAERVLPLQTQSNVLRRGLGAPSRLGKRPIITVYPDLVYTESCLRALYGLAILCF